MGGGGEVQFSVDSWNQAWLARPKTVAFPVWINLLNSVVQNQKAVTPYHTSQQLLPLVFAKQNTTVHTKSPVGYPSRWRHTGDSQISISSEQWIRRPAEGHKSVQHSSGAHSMRWSSLKYVHKMYSTNRCHLTTSARIHGIRVVLLGETATRCQRQHSDPLLFPGRVMTDFDWNYIPNWQNFTPDTCNALYAQYQHLPFSNCSPCVTSLSSRLIRPLIGRRCVVVIYSMNQDIAQPFLNIGPTSTTSAQYLEMVVQRHIIVYCLSIRHMLLPRLIMW